MRMKTAIIALLQGLLCSLAIFAASAWTIYSVLWKWYGMDNIPPGSMPGVMMGGYAAFVDGVFGGAVFGLLFLIFSTRYFYRRLQKRLKPQVGL